MNRLRESTLYQVREELKDVVAPWASTLVRAGSLAGASVGCQPLNLPRKIFANPPESPTWKQVSPLSAACPDQNKAARAHNAVEDGMKILQPNAVQCSLSLARSLEEFEEEPDDTWAMLESENEARFRFDSFLSRLRLDYSEFARGPKKRMDFSKHELPPMRREKLKSQYHDPRCENTKKQLPMVCEAPPYPEYWLLKKKPPPKPSAVVPEQEPVIDIPT